MKTNREIHLSKCNLTSATARGIASLSYIQFINYAELKPVRSRNLRYSFYKACGDCNC